MVWVLPVFATLVLVAAVFFLFLRFQQSSLKDGFRLLGDSFESLQRNLTFHQKEFERLGDQKSLALRGELSQELERNRRELQLGLQQTTTALETKVSAMDLRLDDRLKEMATGVQTKLELNIKEGFRHFEKVQDHLKQAEIQLLNLNTVGKSINDLNSLLKLPHLRGGFGEAMLEQILSDLLPADGYELQYKIVPGSTERVDAVIKYPSAVLPIDSKFPREQILPLFETNDPQALEIARKNLGDVMRVLAKQIREKYIRPEHGTTDMALLFVPSETLYFEVLRNVRVCEELSRNKVFAASPNTLAVTLHAISIARNYYEMAKGVEKTISEVRKAGQHFENFERKFEEISGSLTKAQTAFHTAATHLSRYRSAVSRLTGPTGEDSSLPPEKLPAPPQGTA